MTAGTQSLLKHVAPIVLRHPLTKTLRRQMREMWWRARGLTIANPPIPDQVRSISFVCLGNICRSPFASLAASRLLEPRNIRCYSGGINTKQSARSPEQACVAAAKFQITLADHRPTPISAESLAEIDMIVVMEVGQSTLLKARYPAIAGRIFLLPLFDAHPLDAYERYNIADPFGQSDAVYDHCYERLHRAIGALCQALSRH